MQQYFMPSRIDNMPELIAKEPDWSLIERAEKLLHNSGATIVHSEADRAFYRLSTDSIHLPPKDSFRSTDPVSCFHQGLVSLFRPFPFHLFFLLFVPCPSSPFVLHSIRGLCWAVLHSFFGLDILKALLSNPDYIALYLGCMYYE